MTSAGRLNARCLGLGYVGIVWRVSGEPWAQRLSGRGQPRKADMVKPRGEAPSRKTIGELVAEKVAAGTMCGETDYARAVANRPAGVRRHPFGPERQHGHPYLVTGQRGDRSSRGDRPMGYKVVSRSTWLRQRARDRAPGLEAASGRRAGEDFGLAVNPNSCARAVGHDCASIPPPKR